MELFFTPIADRLYSESKWLAMLKLVMRYGSRIMSLHVMNFHTMSLMGYELSLIFVSFAD